MVVRLNLKVETNQKWVFFQDDFKDYNEKKLQTIITKYIFINNIYCVFTTELFYKITLQHPRFYLSSSRGTG